MKEITLDTKIADLLNNYEGMKEILIDINPKFEKLNNPVLRRTLAKIAGVRQAAIVGGMEPQQLLNRLRAAVGQQRIEQVSPLKTEQAEAAPAWIEREPKVTIDANALLDADENPLVHANKSAKSLREGEILLILSDFQPEPLIEEFEKKGYGVYCREKNEDQFLTYIRK